MRKNIIGIITFLAFILLASCKSDDDLSQNEQNTLDDLAIIKYLESHYLGENGKVLELSDNDRGDDEKLPLYKYAQRDEMGYWYAFVKNATTDGDKITNSVTDSILIQYEASFFNAVYVSDTVSYKINKIESTINGTGQPKWDPFFYHRFLTQSELDKGLKLDYFTCEGFIDGLKHFPATHRAANATPSVNFQGIIIVPSRLYRGRKTGLYGYSSYETLSNDTGLIVNFELYDFINRD